MKCPPVKKWRPQGSDSISAEMPEASDRHTFHVPLEKNEALDVARMIHAAFSGVFTGAILLVGLDETGGIFKERLGRTVSGVCDQGSAYRSPSVGSRQR